MGTLYSGKISEYMSGGERLTCGTKEEGVKVMTKKGKAELLEEGENFSRGIIEALFNAAIQKRDFESAYGWMREY